MTSASFDPTPAPQLIEWLDLAARLQLERDLADLPILAELLDRNYFHLLAKGDRNPLDSAVRYVVKFDALDLADRRFKPAYTAADPVIEADTARRMGARRQGILPTLASWVGIVVDDMHRHDAWHRIPTDPDQIVWAVDAEGISHPSKPGPSVASEAGWLGSHVEWIVGQPYVIELADELRRIVLDLAALGIEDAAPNRHATMTAEQIDDAGIASRRSVYRWFKEGWLTDVGKVDRKRVFVVHEVKELVEHPPWDRVVRTQTLEEITTTFGVSRSQDDEPVPTSF